MLTSFHCPQWNFQLPLDAVLPASSGQGSRMFQHTGEQVDGSSAPQRSRTKVAVADRGCDPGARWFACTDVTLMVRGVCVCRTCGSLGCSLQ
jgi:hypothetical protein